MPTVSGKYKFNDNVNISQQDSRSTTINFTDVSGTEYDFMQVTSTGRRTSVSYRVKSTQSLTQVYTSSNWSDANYQTIDFGTDAQEMDSNFYGWFSESAVQQEEPVAPTTTKTVSSDNLARFKQKCDETYAKIGEGGGTQLYKHEIATDRDGAYAEHFYVISTVSTPYSDLEEVFQTIYSSTEAFVSVYGTIQIWNQERSDYDGCNILGADYRALVVYNAITPGVERKLISSITVSWMGDTVKPI